jgi:hypothetical protein
MVLLFLICWQHDVFLPARQNFILALISIPSVIFKPFSPSLVCLLGCKERRQEENLLSWD